MEVVTIKDIAKICGVGVSTVSRAINDHPDINEDTKAQIMEVVEKYNYRPNNSARNLKRLETNTIAVLIKGISNTFFNIMLKVLEKEVQEKKYTFLLHRVEEHEIEIDVALALEKEMKLKGIMFLGGYFAHSRDKLRQLKVPYVLSSGAVSEINDINEFPIVTVDNLKESYKMVDYLCKLGHERIAIVTAPPSEENLGKNRLGGYKKALEDNGIQIDENLINFLIDDSMDTYSMKYGYEVTKKLLASTTHFTALYAIADSMAVGACKAIFEAGKRIPEDFSVAGFDGTDITYYYQPSITTLKQPVIEMAYKSIHILFDMIDGKIKKDSKILQGELIVRESTRRLNNL